MIHSCGSFVIPEPGLAPPLCEHKIINELFDFLNHLLQELVAHEHRRSRLFIFIDYVFIHFLQELVAHEHRRSRCPARGYAGRRLEVCQKEPYITHKRAL